MRHLAHKVRRLTAGLLGGAEPVILMYHRVADAPIDPWGLAVSPRNFAAQMRELKRLREPVPLDELVEQALDGKPQKNSIAITFDDAYRDVLLNAKPILAELGIPATVFVVTGKLGCERGFWWDRLAAAVLGNAMPEALPAFFFADAEAVPGLNRALRTGDRSDLHLQLWSLIRLLGPDERDKAVDEVARAFGTPAPGDAAVMSAQEIGSLIDGGLIAVGAHSVSHPSLPSLSTEDQRVEIGQSRDALQSITGEPVRRLAYPFGDYDDRSIQIARELGFDYAVSVETGSIGDPAARYRLPRHDIKNWTGSEFGKRLRWRI